jgi:hypothetical protein
VKIEKNKESNRNVTTLILLATGFIFTVIAAFFTPTPPREGNVVGKRFIPAHFQSTGKSIMYIEDSWQLVIENCTERNNCNTGIYSVSQTTHDNTPIGAYLSFKVENSFGRWIIRTIIFCLGIACLWVIFMAVAMMSDFGYEILDIVLGGIIVSLCGILGYGCIFFAIKGLEGFL